MAGSFVGMVNPQEEREHWVVGGRNVTWKEMIQMMTQAMGKKRHFISVPNLLVYLGAVKEEVEL